MKWLKGTEGKISYEISINPEALNIDSEKKIEALGFEVAGVGLESTEFDIECSPKEMFDKLNKIIKLVGIGNIALAIIEENGEVEDITLEDLQRTVKQAGFIGSEEIKKGEINFNITIPIIGNFELRKEKWDKGEALSLRVDYDKWMENEIDKQLKEEFIKLGIPESTFKQIGGHSLIGFLSTAHEKYY